MSSKKITELNHKEVKRFFMQHSSYINFELPEYFNFEELLRLVAPLITSDSIANICKKKDNSPDGPHHYETINHTILSNKDGAYSWRPLQIIHPVLYLHLVSILTERTSWEYIQTRFKSFSETYVECISIPRKSYDANSDKASQVNDWWERIEQHSIKKSLEYNYIFITDISDCYGSLYTHSIEWALDKDGKDGVKRKIADKKTQKKKTLGGKIDGSLRKMNYNQTNGIPQGSTLTDFIAEIILGYADEQLTMLIREHNIKEDAFHIVRYRDDYRIFVNDPNVGHQILKLLSTALHGLGLKMNASKTLDSSDIIIASLKKEKLERIFIAPAEQYLQKEALRIYQLSRKYPNSGVVAKELSLFYDRIERKRKYDEDIEVLIVIFAMTAFYSPKVITWVSAIISKLLKNIKSDEMKKTLIEKIHNKFKLIPNTGLIDVWLQRISEPLKNPISYSDKLSKIALGDIKNSELWECLWLKDNIVQIINIAKISDFKEKVKSGKISPVIERKEVELFKIPYN